MYLDVVDSCQGSLFTNLSCYERKLQHRHRNCYQLPKRTKEFQI